MKFKKFDLLVIDIDGVMTDGTKLYDTYGNIYLKKFNDKDFSAIKRFKELGVEVCFLSADQNINKATQASIYRIRMKIYSG